MPCLVAKFKFKTKKRFCQPRKGVDARVAAMALRIGDGETLQAVANDYGITRERVRQLVKRAGITGHDGSAVRVAKKVAAARARRDAKYLAWHGCTYAQYRSVVGRRSADTLGYERTPMGAFQRQRQSAAYRGIKWQFKFWDWWQVWERSGHWTARGRTGYVMARLNDTGPYAPGNVKVVLATENIAEYYERERAVYGRVRSGHERKAA